MALDGESPHIERVGTPRGSRLPPVLIVLAAGLVLLLVLRPWGSGIPLIPDLGPSRPRVTNPPATALRAAGPPLLYFQQCFPYAGWRLTAIQQAGAQEVRTAWPVAARFEPTLSRDEPGNARLFGGGVSGIGFCTPGDDAAATLRNGATVTLWRREPSGALAPVEGARVIDPRLAELGEVYLAPPSSISTDGDWPAGDYFFEVGSTRPGTTVSWLPLQLLPRSAEPTRAPTVAPSARPSPGSVVQAVGRP